MFVHESHNKKEKSRPEMDSEVMSSSIKGGDVDCICVWMHKMGLYSHPGRRCYLEPVNVYKL